MGQFLKSAAAIVMLAACFTGVSGCSGNKTAEAPAEATIENSEDVFTFLREGLVLNQAAVDSVQAASDSLSASEHGMDGAFLQALREARELLDAAGEQLAEAGPPPENAAAATTQEWDDQRLAAIERGNDALVSIEQAEGILSSLVESADENQAPRVADALELIGVAVEDTVDAIRALGGVVESDGSGDAAEPTEEAASAV